MAADVRNPNSNALYSSTKLHNKVFASQVYYPPSANINSLIIKPGWVSTPMTMNKKVSIVTAGLQEEVDSIIKSVGFTSETNGSIKHLFLNFLLGLIPTPIFLYIVSRKITEKSKIDI